MADELLVMKGGKVVESGPTESIFNNPQQAYTRRLISAAFEIRTLADADVDPDTEAGANTSI